MTTHGARAHTSTFTRKRARAGIPPLVRQLAMIAALGMGLASGLTLSPVSADVREAPGADIGTGLVVHEQR